MANDLVADITGLVDEARPRFLAATVDKSIVFEREAAFAVQAIMAQSFTRDTALQNPQSVVNAVANISAMGLTLNPAKRQAYLVPRDGKICLDVGYIGLLDIAIESGAIRWGQAELVYAADRFALQGVDQQPLHERNPFASPADRGDVIGVYVVVKTRDGDFLTTTMAIEEILSIRDRSSAWKKRQSGPWLSDFGEMAKKTVIKRAYKLWPKSEKLDRVVHHLNTEGEEGLDVFENEPSGGDVDPLEQPRYLGLSVQKAKEIRKACGEALKKWNVDDGWGAWEILEPYGDDNDHLQAVWKALAPFSDLRAHLKKCGQEKRDREAAIAAMPKEPPPSEDAK